MCSVHYSTQQAALRKRLMMLEGQAALLRTQVVYRDAHITALRQLIDSFGIQGPPLPPDLAAQPLPISADEAASDSTAVSSPKDSAMPDAITPMDAETIPAADSSSSTAAAAAAPGTVIEHTDPARNWEDSLQSLESLRGRLSNIVTEAAIKIRAEVSMVQTQDLSSSKNDSSAVAPIAVGANMLAGSGMLYLARRYPCNLRCVLMSCHSLHAARPLRSPRRFSVVEPAVDTSFQAPDSPGFKVRCIQSKAHSRHVSLTCGTCLRWTQHRNLAKRKSSAITSGSSIGPSPKRLHPTATASSPSGTGSSTTSYFAGGVAYRPPLTQRPMLSPRGGSRSSAAAASVAAADDNDVSASGDTGSGLDATAASTGDAAGPMLIPQPAGANPALAFRPPAPAGTALGSMMSPSRMRPAPLVGSIKSEADHDFDPLTPTADILKYSNLMVLLNVPSQLPASYRFVPQDEAPMEVVPGALMHGAMGGDAAAAATEYKRSSSGKFRKDRPVGRPPLPRKPSGSASASSSSNAPAVPTSGAASSSSNSEAADVVKAEASTSRRASRPNSPAAPSSSKIALPSAQAGAAGSGAASQSAAAEPRSLSKKKLLTPQVVWAQPRGTLNAPADVTFDGQGRLFVCERSSKTKRIAVFGSDSGRLLYVFGAKQFTGDWQPCALAHDRIHNRIYVADMKSDLTSPRIHAFHVDGKHLFTYAQEASQPKPLIQEPDGLGVTRDGKCLMVSEYGTSSLTLLKIEKNGFSWQRSVRPPEPFTGAFTPQCVRSDSQGNVWVADATQGRVFCFNPQFELLRVVPAKTVLLSPRSFALDETRRRMYVASRGRVYGYSFEGRVACRFGKRDKNLSVVACLPDGSVVVCDPASNRMLVYEVPT